MRHLLLPLISLLLATAVAADTVILNDGRKLEGTVTEVGDVVIVKTPIGSMEFPKHTVKRIERGLAPADEYPVRLKKLGEKPTAKQRIELARWCKEKKLNKEMRTEYEAALAQEPENVEAHEALGHVQSDGVWVTREQAYEAQGYVRYKNEWIPKTEKERREAEERVRVLLMKATGRKESESQAARDELATIAPEHRVNGALGHLSNSMRTIRKLSVETIGAAMPLVEEAWVKNGGYDGQQKWIDLKWKVVERLVKSSVADRDEEVRKAAHSTVKAVGREEAGPWYTKAVVERLGSERVQAALALADLEERPSVVYLLYTFWATTIEIRATSAQMNPAPVLAGIYPLNVSTNLGSNAAGTLTANVQIETPRLQITRLRTTATFPGGVSIEMERDAVVFALQSITGAKHGPDYPAWLAWWEKNKQDYLPNVAPADSGAPSKDGGAPLPEEPGS